MDSECLKQRGNTGRSNRSNGARKWQTRAEAKWNKGKSYFKNDKWMLFAISTLSPGTTTLLPPSLPPVWNSKVNWFHRCDNRWIRRERVTRAGAHRRKRHGTSAEIETVSRTVNTSSKAKQTLNIYTVPGRVNERRKAKGRNGKHPLGNWRDRHREVSAARGIPEFLSVGKLIKLSLIKLYRLSS